MHKRKQKKVPYVIEPIKRAAVLGAGVMGAQIAAHLANARIPTLLLDRVPPEHATGFNPEARNQLTSEGIEWTKRMKPGVFFVSELEKLITIGNFEDDLRKLSEVDWIIEVVAEDLKIKQSLLQRANKYRRPGCIVSTNTSGLPISKIAENFEEDFQQFFLGTHFFNPPRYMKLLEIIPTTRTLPDVVAAISVFAKTKLGKSVVFCKDTPNFIANRIGTFAVCLILNAMETYGLSIEDVDSLTGSAIGRPRSATFRTLDLVGLDTFAHVAQNLCESTPDDLMRDYFKLPKFVSKMLEQKLLGEKAGQGFYKKIKQNGQSEILTLDLSNYEFRPKQRPKLASSRMAAAAQTLADKLRALASAKDKGGEFFRHTTCGLLAYAANKIPEITPSMWDMDQAMRLGFNWQLGPFELWDALDVEQTAGKIVHEGFKCPAWVNEMLASGRTSFYEKKSGQFSAYDLAKKTETPIQFDPTFINLTLLKEKPGRILNHNPGASLIDLGSKALCLEFHSKMNVIGEDTLQMADAAFRLLETDYDGLIIGNQGDNFCAGANLMLILMLAQEEEWDELETAVRRFQAMNMRIKHSSRPVIVAPFRQTLGGGCEIVLQAPKVCASAESYIGLVEVRAGLIPAGGGTKEMVCRAAAHSSSQGKNVIKIFEKMFENMLTAAVSTSADEAKKLGYLKEDDPICMNADYLIHEARETLLAAVQQGYQPLPIETPTVLGKPFYTGVAVKIDSLLESKQIPEHQARIGKKLAHVISGGDFALPQQVSEQQLLDLERETFLSLVGERKTQEMMTQLLKT